MKEVTGPCIPGHTSVLGTLTLTQTPVPTDPAGLCELASTGAGVHGDGLADDKAIADELADGLARVGVGDLSDLIRVEPDLALAAADHGGGEALLGAKVDPVERKKQNSVSLGGFRRWAAPFPTPSLAKDKNESGDQCPLGMIASLGRYLVMELTS